MTFVRAGNSDDEAPGSTSRVESTNRECALGNVEPSAITKVWLSLHAAMLALSAALPLSRQKCCFCSTGLLCTIA